MYYIPDGKYVILNNCDIIYFKFGVINYKEIKKLINMSHKFIF